MTSAAIRHEVRDHGYAVASSDIPDFLLSKVASALELATHGQRHVLGLAPVAELARSAAVRNLVEPVLGKAAFAVSATFFNKRPEANWKVTWHQDVMVTVGERREVNGWGPWSEKNGVLHVRPPAQVMEQVVAVRIHLDDCGKDNGPLRVIPESHKYGYLSVEKIEQWCSKQSAICTAKRGDVLMMRPLLLHASSAATRPENRRVLHLEFAAEDLPDGMEWRDRLSSS